jgi:hypothetical protein
MRYGNPSKKTRVVSTLKGHSIEFPGRGSVDPATLPAPQKGHEERATIVDSDGLVYVWVPSTVRGEVEQAGLQSETERDDLDEPPNKLKPEDPEQLRKAAFDAFEILVATGERESFSGNGTPKAAAIEKLLGYPLTNGDIKDLWPKFRLAQSEK